MITPYGTILELNIGNDLTFNPVQDEKSIADPIDSDASKLATEEERELYWK